MVPASSQVDGRIVVTGGMTLGGLGTPAILIYDPNSNHWTTGGSLLQPRFRHAQLTLPGSRVLIAGGWRRSTDKPLVAMQSVELLEGAALVSRGLEPLPERIHAPTAHLLNDTTAVVIGETSAAVLDLEALTWSTIKLHVAHREHASLQLDEQRILVVGGHRQSVMEVVDVQAGTSQKLAAVLPFPLDDAALLRIDAGRVWILGGQSFAGKSGNTTDQTWVLHLGDTPQSARLEPGPLLQIKGGMADHHVLRLPGGDIVVGGETQKGGKDVELRAGRLLDALTLGVKALPELPSPHDDGVGEVWQDEAILIGGQVSRQVMGETVPVPVRDVFRLRPVGKPGWPPPTYRPAATATAAATAPATLPATTQPAPASAPGTAPASAPATAPAKPYIIPATQPAVATRPATRPGQAPHTRPPHRGR